MSQINLMKPNFPLFVFNHKLPFTDRIKVLTTPEFADIYREAIENVPDADIDFITSSIPNAVEIEALMSVVNNLLLGAICEECGNKSRPQDLYLCNACKLAWYCNEQCRVMHHDIHIKRCCKADGPLNMGYQRMEFNTVVISRKSGKMRTPRRVGTEPGQG